MIKKLATIAALVMLLGSPISYAAFTSGNELAGYCEADAATFAEGLCGGYVGGVYDINSVGPLICPPQGLTVRQLVSVVRKYFRENPEMLHENAAVLVTFALGEAFPCPD